jgi:putative Mn2+ efflux pump MntP
MIYTIAMILIAAGIAGDNLVLAFVSGKSMVMVKPVITKNTEDKQFHRGGLFLFILLFIIQNMLLMYGDWFGGITKEWLKGEQQLMAVVLLLAMGVKMLKELRIKNRAVKIAMISGMNFWEIGLGTAVYVFAFGCAVNWLDFNQRQVIFALLALIICSLVAGIILGNRRYEKAFKYMNTIAAFLVMAGSLLLIVELFKNNIK